MRKCCFAYAFALLLFFGMLSECAAEALGYGRRSGVNGRSLRRYRPNLARYRNIARYTAPYSLPRKQPNISPRQKCRKWKDKCSPWSREVGMTCCKNDNLTCKCNLWMQNCKCVSSLWG